MGGFFRVSFSIVKKAAGGHKAASKIAYIMRKDIMDLDSGCKVSCKSREKDLLASGIVFPSHLTEEAKQRWSDYARLAQDTEKAEKRVDGQIFRQVIISLDQHIRPEEREEVVKKVCGVFADEGMYALYAIHSEKNGNGNYHAHILLPVRQFDEEGVFSQVKQKKVYANDTDEKGRPIYNPRKTTEEKNRVPVIDPETGKQKIENKSGRRCWHRVTIEDNPWDKRENVRRWRQMIADVENRYLSEDHQVSCIAGRSQIDADAPLSLSEIKMYERLSEVTDRLSESGTGTHMPDLLNQVERYSGITENRMLQGKTLETMMLRILSFFKGLRENNIRVAEAETHENNIRKDLLIFKTFGLTSVMERHFIAAEKFVIDLRIKLLEARRTWMLDRKQRVREEVEHDLSNLRKALGRNSTDPATGIVTTSDRPAGEEFAAQADRRITEALCRTDEQIREIAILLRDGFVGKQQAEIADRRAEEGAAAKERADRDAASERHRTAESTKTHRRI